MPNNFMGDSTVTNNPDGHFLMLDEAQVTSLDCVPQEIGSRGHCDFTLRLITNPAVSLKIL
jgi:hypothetical protein